MRYRPELDGLRAVAILFVIVDHWLVGTFGWVGMADAFGRVGVTLFFVLSGFLITSLLREEREEAGRINLRAFYGRRVARLGPAFLLMTAFVIAVGLLGAWASSQAIWGDWRAGVVWSLLYVGNWAIGFGVHLGPMGHTWSLAVEEQFYLLWPLVLWLGFDGRRAAGAVAVVGLLALVMLQHDFTSTSTISNAFPLALGCLLALTEWRLPTWTAPAAAIAIAIALATGSIAVASLAGVILIASRTTVLARLAPLGRRAYSLYLWDSPFSLLLAPTATIIATFVAAEISYRLVERPFLRWYRSGHGRPTAPTVGAAVAPLLP